MVRHPERSALIRECESVRVVEGSLMVERCGWFKREFRGSRVRDFWALLGLSSEVFGIGILRLRMGLSCGQVHASLRMTNRGNDKTWGRDNAELRGRLERQLNLAHLPT